MAWVQPNSHRFDLTLAVDIEIDLPHDVALLGTDPSKPNPSGSVVFREALESRAVETV
jgi:hypothetical protein